jgi:hypothetical protein
MTGDAHRRRDHHGEHDAVRCRDGEQHVLRPRHLRRHDRGTPDEHEGEDADELGGEVAPAVAHDYSRVRVAPVRGCEPANYGREKTSET